MRSRARHAVLAVTGAALAGAPLVLTVSPADAAGTRGTISVHRGGPARSLPFTAHRDGEAVISFAASAPGVSWAREGAESAVVSIAVDGRHVTDLVVPSSDPIPRGLGLGHVGKGRHKVTLRFAKGSAPAARRVTLRHPEVRMPVAEALALRHAPVVVGRTGWPLGDPYQNATTDAPLIAWHETRPADTPGHKIIEYSVVWSNEDGGTDTPALMARWGRTTDIEWIYRVEVDASGRRVDGTGVYQAPMHLTLKFTGRYEGDHPVLQTCTDNNNMCDVVSPDAPLRFLLDASRTRPDGRAREVVMDREPWTYRIAAQEMVREGKIESPSDPATPGVGDQRTYLFAEFAKTTGGATGTGSVPGVALGVRLKSDPSALYRSDHDEPTWSIDRDGAVATTVELPAGTAVSDIASIEAVRRPTGAGDNGAPATVTSINRGFFLDDSYLPQPSSVTWQGSVTLTQAEPSAVLWRP
ncbi:hypothetical protein E1293_27115 [Actinomadura darangshiensis]|uniref:Uncharacterized protein n=1 Tax=Actinomadura darangshiensis TaxID=705336 RepID=A0A4R5AXN5_9ACTN|nr:hypothetical protein [Actinomadura darangshiensis]TDD76506.1 hypothetical protein E1293_27115 [Actinomadura darangshiensis]